MAKKRSAGLRIAPVDEPFRGTAGMMINPPKPKKKAAKRTAPKKRPAPKRKPTTRRAAPRRELWGCGGPRKSGCGGGAKVLKEVKDVKRILAEMTGRKAGARRARRR
ncbi:uncharacterized protein SOCE26_052810 [Sorangium cellulosum]|uniref:Uncharacterized protein n=1 Tax=Sorangium cellulosum TaxID=56 RepID=A0A2L0EX10_SORCE|nr:hypothetical protein [Sorangium cellulosum]AUX43826.1 uncharacterized protein SOCE26_052810 [Sorangium cellulosum]